MTPYHNLLIENIERTASILGDTIYDEDSTEKRLIDIILNDCKTLRETWPQSDRGSLQGSYPT